MRQGEWMALVSYASGPCVTDWTAGNDNFKGAAYNERADERSWKR